MANASKPKKGLSSYEISAVEDTQREAVGNDKRLIDIPIAEIDDFPDHPFRVREDEDMTFLIESINERGVISSAIVRRKEDGRYELISGHRRTYACEKLGITTLPCQIVDVSRDEAIILMVDSNNQRTEISPCDKGKAYRMKLEAIKRQQGERSDLTEVLSVQNLVGKSSRELLAQGGGESHEQIRRYIRLTYLIPGLQKYVDDRKIKIRPAVELSYLSEEAQREILDSIEESAAFPSHGQAIRIRNAYEAGELAEGKASEIMNELKPNQKPKINVKYEKAKKYLPADCEEENIEAYILKALEHYQKYLRRQRDQAR